MSVSTILLAIIIGALFFLMMKRGGCCGIMGHGGHGGHGPGGGQGGHPGHGGVSGGGSSQMIKDPVCGMFVDSQTSISSRHMGKTFHFCSAACKGNFDKEPMKYRRKEDKKISDCG